MSVTAYGNGNISLTTQDNMVLSTMVTDYTPESEINTTSELVERVTMTGIDRIFHWKLDEPDSIKLLNSFTVSNLRIDPTLNEIDPNVTGLAVALSASGDFADVIRGVVEQAADASDNVVNYASATGAIDAAGAPGIKQYLETRLRNAFLHYFASSMGMLTPTTGWASDADGSTLQLTGGNTGVSDEELSEVATMSGDDAAVAGTGVIASAVSTTAITELTGFTVAVDVSEGAMATACTAMHYQAGNAEERLILFRQIRKTTFLKYYDGSGDRLNTNALPMEKGQSFVVVFDIDVKSSGGRSNDGAKAVDGSYENLPSIASSQAGARNFQLNMGNRRVAFEIELDGAVGDGIFALRADAGKVLAPGYVAPAPGGPGGL